MNFDDTLEEMNITLGDSGDVTFTPEEKLRALQKAWKDPYVSNEVWDTSLSFNMSSYQYAKPTTLDTITGIYIRPTGGTDSEPANIGSNLWSVVGSNIQFSSGANNIIPQGFGLFIKGRKRLDYTADTITDPTVQEYVIALGGYNTVTQLMFKKANLFLKNDTTLAELIAMRRELAQDVSRLRSSLATSFEAV